MRSDEPDEVNPVGLSDTAPPPEPITRNALMRTLLTVFFCIILGYLVQRAVLGLGLMLPLFVPCLLVGLVVGNLLGLVPFVKPVAHTPALSLVSEFALGVFLAVSLMALQLWALAGMAGTLLAVLAVQTAIAVAVSLLIAFRLLGRDYQAAVLTAGYASFVLGATPTAIATMTAVTKRYGPCQTAFIVLPLVSAVFVDLANALVTQGFLDLWAGHDGPPPSLSRTRHPPAKRAAARPRGAAQAAARGGGRPLPGLGARAGRLNRRASSCPQIHALAGLPRAQSQSQD